MEGVNIERSACRGQLDFGIRMKPVRREVNRLVKEATRSAQIEMPVEVGGQIDPNAKRRKAGPHGQSRNDLSKPGASGLAGLAVTPPPLSTSDTRLDDPGDCANTLLVQIETRRRRKGRLRKDLGMHIIGNQSVYENLVTFGPGNHSLE